MRLCRGGMQTDCIKSQIQISCAKDNTQTHKKRRLSVMNRYTCIFIQFQSADNQNNYTATIKNTRI